MKIETKTETKGHTKKKNDKVLQIYIFQTQLKIDRTEKNRHYTGKT